MWEDIATVLYRPEAVKVDRAGNCQSLFPMTLLEKLRKWKHRTRAVEMQMFNGVMDNATTWEA